MSDASTTYTATLLCRSGKPLQDRMHLFTCRALRFNVSHLRPTITALMQQPCNDHARLLLHLTMHGTSSELEWPGRLSKCRAHEEPLMHPRHPSQAVERRPEGSLRASSWPVKARSPRDLYLTANQLCQQVEGLLQANPAAVYWQHGCISM